MKEITSIAANRLRSKAEVSFVESLDPLTEPNFSYEVSSLHAEALKFKEGLEMAQSIYLQLQRAMHSILPE